MRKSNWKKTIARLSLCAAIGVAGIHIGSLQTASAATPESEKLLDYGKQYLGVPYRLGAPSGVTYAFDCSSFTQYVFEKNGITLPRTSSQQAQKGDKVARGYLSKGDLVFFTNSNGKGIGHVAIYAGSNKILHTYGKTGVTVSSLGTSYWNKHYVTAKRVL
ncbi:C40 family peptidase [Paenibacillus pasadenensis]|uniref:Invasion associated protein p60 n=1 Tax=Paenibacillus pasadenensis TaxID=217090 RepID=A0A2N5N664_9BACL|nr:MULTISPECIES: C40 family peptidase [Paenibacillus]PLT45847.1 Invasion associated protein p60 [Paenibacillus pasadenensis]QGG56277.1 NlpC/P60 family protein [Paenibacillus sp. B01]